MITTILNSGILRKRPAQEPTEEEVPPKKQTGTKSIYTCTYICTKTVIHNNNNVCEE